MSRGTVTAVKGLAGVGVQDDGSMTTYGICIGTWY
jgi:hypothetical protein